MSEKLISCENSLQKCTFTAYTHSFFSRKLLSRRSVRTISPSPKGVDIAGISVPCIRKISFSLIELPLHFDVSVWLKSVLLENTRRDTCRCIGEKSLSFALYYLGSILTFIEGGFSGAAVHLLRAIYALYAIHTVHVFHTIPTLRTVDMLCTSCFLYTSFIVEAGLLSIPPSLTVAMAASRVLTGSSPAELQFDSPHLSGPLPNLAHSSISLPLLCM